MKLLGVLLLAVSALQAAEGFLPVAVWYGGGKARAPMVERNARAQKDQWRKDLDQIRGLGFNSIRAWLDWSAGEPRRGAYDFSTVEVLLELCEEMRLKLILQVYLDSAPAWVGREFPGAAFVSSNGMAIRPESAPGYCRDHAGVHAAEIRFLDALAQRLGRSPAFHAWDLWSEPHVINWANPTYISRPEFCWCEHTQARFRRWLQKRYPALEQLNDAWYRRYEAWDEVEPPRLSTILSYRDYLDWKHFIVDKLGEDLRARYEAVKRHTPQAETTSHAAAVGLFTSPHHWEGQGDDWVFARQVDYYGTSFYPKHSAFVDRDPAWRAALLDFTRSFGFASGRNGFYIGELQAGFGTIATNLSSEVTPGDLRIWIWSALARAARAVCLYAWYPMSTGYEAGGFGLVHLDGTLTERAREAGRIAREVSKHQKELAASKPWPAEVAVVYNPLMHFVGGRQRAAAYGGPQGEAQGIERDSLLGIYRALFPRSVPMDYVHANELDSTSLAPYKLIYLPYPAILPESARRLKDWVAKGGTLVAEARPAWTLETGAASEIIPGLGLHEVFGAREAAVETPPGGRTRLLFDSPAFQGEAPGRWMEESLEPLGPLTEILARFPSGRTAATRHKYAKGQAILLGSFLSAAYENQPTEDGRRLFEALLQWAGVRAPVRFSGDPVEVRLLRSGQSTLVFVLNHAKTPANASLTLPGQVQRSLQLPAQGVHFEILN
jgi:beta-galactosidase